MKSLRMISYVILALGVLVFIVGLLFKIQHWPDIFNGLTKGLALIITGTVFFLISLVKMRANSFQLIKFCCTRPDSYRDVPAAETKSIGLQADALVPCLPTGR